MSLRRGQGSGFRGCVWLFSGKSREGDIIFAEEKGNGQQNPFTAFKVRTATLVLNYVKNKKTLSLMRKCTLT